jgi:outer membrane protein assembly factor BamB
MLLLMVFSLELCAGNWPQWRGPLSNGVSTDSRLPVHWSAVDHIVWEASLDGLGASSPIVWEDAVFVSSQKGRAPVQPGENPRLARDDSDLAKRENPIGGRRTASEGPAAEVSLVLEAFRISDGRRLWEYSARAKGELPKVHEKHNLATPTPVTDGKLIFAWFGNGQLFALDMRGHLVWTRHLGIEYAAFDVSWGHGGSPVLYGNTLILLCDHGHNSYLVAVDKATGTERWKVGRGNALSHSTPLVVNGPKGDELIVNSSERIDSYNPINGDLLWYTGSQRQTPIPSPVFHDGVIYLSRGYRNSDFLAIRPGGRGDISESHVLWRAPGGASYVPSILFYKGLLYVTNEVGIVTCAEAETGKTLWRKRLGGIFYASPVAGDGKIYWSSETGETYILSEGREGDVIARNELGERIIASPAISNGHLFVRSDGTLYCIGDAVQQNPPERSTPSIR